MQKFCTSNLTSEVGTPSENPQIRKLELSRTFLLTYSIVAYLGRLQTSLSFDIQLITTAHAKHSFIQVPANSEWLRTSDH
jgi:hypothetical protein